MTRDGGIPRPPSRAISASTCATDSATPCSSARLARSSSRMSYQARIATPPLIVTGRTGACGNTNRTAGQPSRTSSGTIGRKSLPSAPRPCSQTTAQRGSGAVSCSRVSSSAFASNPFSVPIGLIALQPAGLWHPLGNRGVAKGRYDRRSAWRQTAGGTVDALDPSLFGSPEQRARGQHVYAMATDLAGKILSGASAAPGPGRAQALSDQEARQAIIRDSIARTPGKLPVPVSPRVQ